MAYKGVPGSYQTHMDAIDGCVKCGLSNFRTKIVKYRGNPASDLMVVGEAPGYHEDKQGKPMVGKTGSYLVNVLSDNGMTLYDYYITNVVLCVDGYTLVKTEDGNKRINQIVKERYQGKVLSVDSSGQLVWKNIVGWHRNPVGGRRVFHIRFSNGKANPKGYAGGRFTEDHPILTKRGYVNVADLTQNDLVATGTPSPTENTEQIIIGSLLGDGSISKGGCYSERHCIAQIKYFFTKLTSLIGTFGGKTRVVNVVGDGIIYKSIGKIYQYINSSLNRSLYFQDLYREWYPHGKKVFPESIVSKASHLALAVMYMDDGYFRVKMNKQGTVPREGSKGWEVEIALGKISEVECDRILRLFKSFNYDVYIVRRDIVRLYFRYGKADQFFADIAQYITSDMRYKLPEKYQDIPFNSLVYSETKAYTYWSSVVIEESQSSDPNNVYCIDVDETHNFATPGGVVHNCRPPGNDTPTPEYMGACAEWLNLQIDLVQPKYILAAGNIAASRLIPEWNANTRITKEAGKLFKPPHLRGIVVIPIVHPSAVERNPSQKPAYEDQIRRICAMIKGEIPYGTQSQQPNNVGTFGVQG